MKMERLNSETIQGHEFYFQKVGAVVLVSFGGYMDHVGDFVAVFRTKEIAVESLRSAKITGDKNQIKITRLNRALDPRYL